ncbi:uncharacterized protein CXQ87_000264 [Candidozyma duobushaemuli]|uniref:DNA polymerase n=1 Tax=Candidozyma duobushaemuli TaxID=1231522 RepID=A0A2V1AHB0_9ASCO|nr:uncharacterized protein CXQ87_000264 [[Candida] duobushaemulonis]PVH17379.1 hypothetical protein CXQ87_000264 [[Candida] duobushaemulonis]
MANALQIQICDLDAYQHVATPLDQLYGLVSKVPFVRIYGALKVEAASNLAYNVLVHVHNYYPYFYIDCPPRQLDEAYLSRLKNHFDIKIHESFQRKPRDGRQTSSNFVAAVEYCRGAPVYGYHLGYKQVLKVSLLSPLYKTRLVKLITSHKVDVWNYDGNLKKSHGAPNLYEAHIPFTSQFLADFNLYGCGFLNVEKCHFRSPLVTPSQYDLSPLKDHLRHSINKGNVLSGARYPRIGRSLLELDISAGDVLNRANLVERTNHNDLSEFNKTMPSEHIYLSSLKFTFEDLKYQCTLRNMNDTSQLLHKSYSQVFTKIGQDGYQEWETSARYRELVAYVARLNAATKFNDANDYYDHLIKPTLPKNVPTCFESVDRDARRDRFQNLSLLNYRDDLVQWSSYDDLFTIDEAATATTFSDSNTADPPASKQNSSEVDGSPSPSQNPRPLDIALSSPDLSSPNSSQFETHPTFDPQSINRQADPNVDSVRAIIYHFDDANAMYREDPRTTAIFICLEGLDYYIFSKLFAAVAESLKIAIEIFTSEKEMINTFLDVFDVFDPDILSGYEINASSWGYLAERVFVNYETNLLARLSRSTFKSNGKFGDRWGYTHTSALKINGRHLLNIWRVLRSELSLTGYTLENVCFHLLHQTLPRVRNSDLSQWFTSGNFNNTFMFCKYYVHRLGLTLKIMNVQEMILRNVEQSRLIGIDFNSNFYRGSQFKVESILLRIAKEENMLLNSPSKEQVHDMRALDSIPLIMEPDSNFYKSPLVVLDFQSLYPSIMIAYNYCYSTLLGPIEGFQQGKNVVGYLPHLNIPHGIVDILLKNGGINVSPNGMMFVSAKFRKSILSRMLQEMLNMRINVRAVAGAFREDVELAKLYNSKQIALKLIANVTYGYTSASFSGRMPNSDIADAIVSTGREILTKSIAMIEDSGCDAKVVYGDTDSLFVYFPGRSKEKAFELGKQLARDVTDFFPDPIKLKFEKVYHPCVLLAKKRYVGSCFEFEDQTLPKFEAKGIETIRRDGIPAQSKMVGKTLRILFETKDLSKVKSYTVEQFQKIFFNKVNVKDFCFAKEVRYGSYKNEKYLPPGAIIAKKNTLKDPRNEPQYRERIPYLVIRDSRKERIKDRCVTPEEYVSSYSTDNPLELDFEYYITRVLIPPLERIFNLIGVNIQEWYREMPKSTRQLAIKKRDITKISEFVQSEQCYLCEGNLRDSPSRYLCQNCLGAELGLITDVISMVKQKESQVIDYESIC